jgi:hypothetical protein
MVTLCSFSNSIEASLAKSRLDDRQIFCSLADEIVWNAAGSRRSSSPTTWPTAVEYGLIGNGPFARITKLRSRHWRLMQGYLGYVRVIGRRKPDIKLEAPIVSVPSEYTQKRLLRAE